MNRVLERITDLPAMPDLVAEVLRMTSDPDADLQEVGAAIERDPALAAKILKVSNSPYYGMRQYVGTLKLSLVILGLREVRNIVLGVSVFNALRDNKHVAAAGQAYWAHSFRTARIAKSLGARLNLDLQGEAFVAGLLHDIGKLVLLRQFGDDYVSICRTKGVDALLEAETEAFGFTHAFAANALAQRWNFPQTLTDAIWMHHASEEAALKQAKDPDLAAVVRLANLLAEDGSDEERVALAESEPECWEVLAKAPQPLPAGDKKTALNELLNDSEEATLPIL